MVEKRRKPGRPAYGSREKLIAATCALLAERGFEATSPTMILKRSGVGHGSMYHYFDGKEDLAVAAMDHLRTRTFAILRTASEEAASDDDASEDSDSTPADMDAALDLLFARQAGQALLRLLADPTVAGSVALSKAVQEWCYEVRAVVFVALNGGESDDTPSAALDGLHGVGDPLLTAALGRRLRGSNPAPGWFNGRGRSDERPVTCGSHSPTVTARAHPGPAVAGAVRTQRGPRRVAPAPATRTTKP